MGFVRGGSDQVSESISWEKANSKCLKNFARIYNLKGLFNQLYVGHCQRWIRSSFRVYKLRESEFKMSPNFARIYNLKGLFNQLYVGLCQRWIRSSFRVYKLGESEFKMSQNFARIYNLKGLFNQLYRGGSDQVSGSISWEEVNSKCLQSLPESTI